MHGSFEFVYKNHHNERYVKEKTGEWRNNGGEGGPTASNPKILLFNSRKQNPIPSGCRCLFPSFQYFRRR